MIEKAQPTQSAVIVAVPDLEPAVAEHRSRLDGARRGSLAELRAAEAAVCTHLPIRTRVERARLIAGTDGPASWVTIREFSLGSRGSSRIGLSPPAPTS